jgi:hypothetical protein
VWGFLVQKDIWVEMRSPWMKKNAEKNSKEMIEEDMKVHWSVSPVNRDEVTIPTPSTIADTTVNHISIPVVINSRAVVGFIVLIQGDFSKRKAAPIATAWHVHWLIDRERD